MITVGANSNGNKVYLSPKMANRHGLISGATGTGKTVTLQVLAENFSKIGVPVFTADIKGDLSGLAKEASPHPKIEERIQKIGLSDYSAEKSPTVFWDLYGENGHPIRTTISEMGPVLLSRLLELNETQEGVLQIGFRIADDQGLLLLDLKDLRSLLSWMADNNKEIGKEYGNVSDQSIGAIQRRLLVLEEAGAEKFFGEPAIKLSDLMHKDFSGRGVVSILDATKLIQNPRLYSTFLLWLLSELFEELDEVGDLEKPRFVFFFDEAHLLFNDAPSSLIEKIETVARLIRSKGVGVYFVTQSPTDIPNTVLGQLGNRFQHALRAFTPKDKKIVKAAADTFRANPAFDTKDAITNLSIGEALVSVLDEEGAPTIVEQTLICPPSSKIGPIETSEKAQLIADSPMQGRYDDAIDRESAFELLKERAIKEKEELEKREEEEEREKEEKRKSRRQSPTEAFFKSILRSVGSSVGRKIARGIMGSILKGR